MTNSSIALQDHLPLSFCTLTATREDFKAKELDHIGNLIGPPLFREVSAEQLLTGESSGYLIMTLAGGLVLRDIFESVPEPFRILLREGRAGLLIDHSREGSEFSGPRMQVWHDLLASAEIPARQVGYITQGREIKSQYLEWCAANGLPEPVRIFNYDYFIKHLSINVTRRGVKPRDEYLRRRAIFQERTEIERAFVCLNFKPRPWRLALMTRLIKDNLWDDGFVSFGGLEEDKLSRARHSKVWAGDGPVEQFKKLPIAEETEDFIEALLERGPIFFGNEESDRRDFGRGRVNDHGLSIYGRSGFSLVPETEMSAYRYRVTEKPFKPLANFHPVIVFGNYQALHELRAFGFQTFDRWIDESYDEIADPEQRFRAAYQSFLEFLPRSRELLQNDTDLRDLLASNAQHALSGLRKHYRQTLDPSLVAEIRGAMPLSDPN